MKYRAINKRKLKLLLVLLGDDRTHVVGRQRQACSHETQRETAGQGDAGCWCDMADALNVAERLAEPAALTGETLLRSYRAADWPDWFAAAGVASPAIGRQALHAARLAFPSPVGIRVEVEAPLPADLLIPELGL